MLILDEVDGLLGKEMRGNCYTSGELSVAIYIVTCISSEVHPLNSGQKRLAAVGISAAAGMALTARPTRVWPYYQAVSGFYPPKITWGAEPGSHTI